MLSDDIRYQIINYSNASYNKCAGEGVMFKSTSGWKKEDSEELACKFNEHMLISNHTVSPSLVLKKQLDNLYLWVPNRPNVNRNPFYNKSIAIYGGSGTGKTTFLKNILHSLKPQLNQVHVICPTNIMNGTYDGIVRSMMIDSKITKEKISNIISRQVILKKYASQFTDLVFIKEHIIPHIPNISARYEKLFTYASPEELKEFSEKYAHAVNDIVRDLCATIDQPIYDNIINSVSEQNVVIVERIKNILRYKGNFKTGSVIIVDDATEDLKECLGKTKGFNKEFADLFTTCRHYNITLIVLVHSYTVLPPMQRQNIHINCFTDTSTFSQFFTKSNSMSNDIVQEAKLVTNLLASMRSSNPDEKYIIANFKENTGFNFYALRSYIMPDGYIINSKSLSELEDRLNKVNECNNLFV